MPSAIVVFIWFCAYLSCAGWVLSWLHQLNAAGYAVTLTAGLAAWVAWCKWNGVAMFPGIHGARLCRRFRRGFPLAFLALAALALVGGALYPPTNYDALAYRTPRVLHWLAEGQWHWVHTDFPRLNTRTTVFEWLTAPQFLFLHTDRLVFLANIVAFLLLPGRIFAVLTRLGVRARAAWYWMWLLPSGYGFVLQAGSVVNDMFGAVMALAALEFALRASREQSASCLWTSILAAALMTSAKAFNIMLLPPWGWALLPALKLMLRRPAAAAAVMALAAAASMIPTSILNAKYCGDWSGANIEHVPIGGGHELLRLPITSGNLALGNLVPPVFPFNRQWEAFVQRLEPEWLKQRMQGIFEGGMMKFTLPELQVEESAGLGCGLTLLLLALLARKIRAREFRLWPRRWLTAETVLPACAWFALLVFVLRVGISCPARYLLPFYVLLIVPFLTGAAAGGVFALRRWRTASYLIFAVAGMLVVLSPSRPLWPAMTVLRGLDAEHSPHPLLHRTWAVYSVYASRADCFAPVIEQLPKDAAPLGYLAFDEPEAALWQPFGSRRLLHISQHDPPEFTRSRGIKYALVCERTLGDQYQLTLADWLAANQAEVVQTFQLRLRAGLGAYGWALVKFK